MTFWICISSFISGLLGAMGFGGGSVLIIYLTVFASVPQVEAQGVNLLFFIPCAIVSIIINLKNRLVRYKIGIFLMLGGVIGIAFGYLLLSNIPTEILGKLFGVFIAAIGLITFFKKQKSEGSNHLSSKTRQE